MKRWLNISSGAYSLLANLTFMGFAFIHFMLVVRMIDVSAFGTWTLYVTLIGFAEMSRMGFVQNGLIKFFRQYHHQRATILSSGLLLNLALALVFWCMVRLASVPLSQWWNTPELPVLTQYYLLFAVTFGTFRFVDYILCARQDFKLLFFANLIYGLLYITPVTLAFFWLPNLPLHWLIVNQSGAATVAMLVMLLWRPSYFSWGRASMKWISRLFQYGKYVCGTNLSSMILNRTDVVMIGFFVGPSAVSGYAIAVKLANYLELPLKSVCQVIYPRMVTKKGSGMARIYEESLGLLLALIVPLSLGAVLLAKPLIILVGGSQYEHAYPILQLLLLGTLSRPFGRLTGLSLDAGGLPHLNFRLTFAGFAVNVLLNLLLIPAYGVLGACMATVSSMLIMAVIGQLYVRQHYPVNLFRAVGTIPGMFQKRMPIMR